MKSAASELTILSILNQIPGKIGNSLWTLWARGANSGTEFPRWEPLLINRKWMVIMPPGAKIQLKEVPFSILALNGN